MVPTFVELEERSIATVWREEETAIVFHCPVPEPTSGNKGESSIIPLASEPRGLTFEVEVREQLASLS